MGITSDEQRSSLKVALSRPRRFLPLQLLVMLSLCPGWATPLASPPSKLAGVRVTGSRNFTEAEIVRASGLAVGKEVSEVALKEAAGRLGATGLFAEVKYRYTTHGPDLTAEFQVSDAPKLLVCKFENFVWFTDEELRSKLRAQVPLFKGEVPPTGNQPDKLSTALEGLLKTRGIKGHVQSTPQGRIGGPVEAIQFRVEGVAILIHQVEFKGAAQVDAAALQVAAQPLIARDYEQSAVAAFAESDLTPLYGQRGYLRVAFGGPTARIVKTGGAGTSVAVTIAINEGPRYRLREIRWTGNSVFPASELAKSIHVASGEPVNATQLQMDLEGVQDAYAAKGYLLAAITPKPTLDHAARSASYELQVREGELFRMGKLEITGVEPFRAEALKKGCRLKAGDAYDKSYWKEFIRDSGRYLSVTPSGWKVDFKQSVYEAGKTVDVTIGFLPQAKQ
jgi:outer membrane protein insertion porin family